MNEPNPYAGVSIALVGFAILLSGCEPERGIRAHRDFTDAVSIDCIDRALRETFGEIERWDYVSGGRHFPEGTSVAQFAYFSLPDRDGWATIKVGSAEHATRIVHDFSGIGAELPQAAFPPALEAMEQATAALERSCKIRLDGMEMREVGQNVEAIG